MLCPSVCVVMYLCTQYVYTYCTVLFIHYYGDFVETKVFSMLDEYFFVLVICTFCLVPV